jgi:hypothetical protein
MGAIASKTTTTEFSVFPNILKKSPIAHVSDGRDGRDGRYGRFFQYPPSICPNFVELSFGKIDHSEPIHAQIWSAILIRPSELVMQPKGWSKTPELLDRSSRLS